jgi:FtsP/CotA-like multicopper oxidase with cupredoxin domain
MNMTDRNRAFKNAFAKAFNVRVGALFIFALFMVPLIAGATSSAAAPVPSREFIRGPGGLLIPHYFGPYPNYATSQLPTVTTDPVTGEITSVSGGIRKFIDSLPGLGEAGANNLGQYMPVAVADTTTYLGSDYYEIAVVQYEEKMHTDLLPTTLRGYVQLETPVNAAVSKHVMLQYPNGSTILKPNGEVAYAVDNPHYLGPFIIAQKNVPARVKFTNLLPTGMAGDLFIPVDTTVMGAGMGPMPMLNPDGTVMYNPDGTVMMEMYTQNRATLHLHGGVTPWISDGTPNQWITPAGEMTPYPEGVSVYNVPDMPDPGAGSQTFFYTNQQSARLMFYHDHSLGITRLNVYVGEAAGYILEDEVEKQLVRDGIIPSVEYPLVIQDKTFVPNLSTPYTNMWGTFSSQLGFQDPTWDPMMWGQEGDLWYPHVYMTMANPADPTGQSMFGRWMYSPWFYPPHMPVNGPAPNPYYAGPGNPMEPQLIPGTPNPSTPGEAFMDTPVVNGAAYPYLNVDPQAYRFRILNAGDDRYWNLQLYVADETVVTPDGRHNTEVKMVPAAAAPGYPTDWPKDGRDGGVPDPASRGPNMIQIGTEGGFLPTPVVLQNRPVDWNWNMGNFDFGLVNKHTLSLGPAERADVIIDFSRFAGKTIILYNDAPAPMPAGDPRQDYYTGNPDQQECGGAPSTVAGYGPNTRTIMQIRVAAKTPAPEFNIAALFDAFATTGTHMGVFAASQDTIIVPQAEYDTAYNAMFPEAAWVRIQDQTITFTPIGSAAPVTMSFQEKVIHDEMGAAYDKIYGRMMVMFGVEQPNPTALTSNVILYDFNEPSTELVSASISGQQIGTLGDGSQIWRINHNGVDSHIVHWHMFSIQLINRVAWDGNIRPPDANELGWKESLRVDPLQDTIVALRPMMPTLPFDLPNSVRPLDPTMPLGAVINPNGVDPSGEAVTIINHMVNYGNEYMWHCHMLSHEENDMMRTIVIATPPRAPNNLVAAFAGTNVQLTWTDNSLSETGFNIDRALDPAFTSGVAHFAVGAGVTTYLDTGTQAFVKYYYRVNAENIVGDTFDYRAQNPLSIGFPTIRSVSDYSNVATPPMRPTGTTTLTGLTQNAQIGAPIVVSWTYVPSGDQAGFKVQRATDSAFTIGVVTGLAAAGDRSYSDGVGISPGVRYYYRVLATNAVGDGTWSNVMSIMAFGGKPTGTVTLTGISQSSAANAPVVITWTYTPGGDQTGFTIQRSTTSAFTANVKVIRTSGNVFTYSDPSNTMLPGTRYYYRVVATNALGQSAWSNSMSIVTKAALPNGVMTLDSVSQAPALRSPVSLAFSYVPGGDQSGIRVQRATNPTFTANLRTINLPATATSYTDPFGGLTPGTTYYYRVAAVNQYGAGAWSNVMSIVPHR